MKELPENRKIVKPKPMQMRPMFGEDTNGEKVAGTGLPGNKEAFTPANVLFGQDYRDATAALHKKGHIDYGKKD